ncbi:MAG: Rieske 2Fe-2S domain-containing protein [Pseudomonadota bacterium]
MTTLLKLCDLADLPDKRAVVHGAEEIAVALCRVGDRVYGFEARCSHALKPLDGARARGGSLMCPHHGARFDLATGKHLAAPAVRGIKAYEIRIENEEVFVVMSAKGQPLGGEDA